MLFYNHKCCTWMAWFLHEQILCGSILTPILSPFLEFNNQNWDFQNLSRFCGCPDFIRTWSKKICPGFQNGDNFFKEWFWFQEIKCNKGTWMTKILPRWHFCHWRVQRGKFDFLISTKCTLIWLHSDMNGLFITYLTSKIFSFITLKTHGHIFALMRN